MVRQIEDSKKLGAYTSYREATFEKRMLLTKHILQQHCQKNRLAKLKILDLGCGIGNPAADLAPLGHSIVSVDIDRKCIDLYNARKMPNAIAYLGNIEDIDFRNVSEGGFNAVICFESLEHVTHPDLVLQNINRHLPSGGLALLSTPSGYSIWEMTGRILHKMGIVSLLYRLPYVYKQISGFDPPLHCAGFPHLHIQFYSLRSLKTLFKSYGFQLTHIFNLNLGVVPAYPKFYELKRIECRLADYIPLWVGGAWLFVASKL